MTGKALRKSAQKLSTAKLTELCRAARRGLRDLQTPEEHIETLLSRLRAAYKADRMEECAEIFRYILETCSDEIEKLKSAAPPPRKKKSGTAAGGKTKKD